MKTTSKLRIFNLVLLWSYLHSVNLFSQTNIDAGELKKDAQTSLATMLNYNSASNSSLSNLTPEIFLGWTNKVTSYKDNISWFLKVGPYASSQINIKDSSLYLPALMMPGNVGLILNNYISLKTKDDSKSTFYLNPLSLSLKLMSRFRDTTNTIIQHGITMGFGYQYTDFFNVSFYYTWGWHNLTSQSEESYAKTFHQKVSDAGYMTINLQTKITGEDNENPGYLYVSYRRFGNNGHYNYLPNSRILTFGIRKTLDFTAITAAFSKAKAAEAVAKAAP